MGRYDKIRCWDGSSWVQPSRMYVWNGSSWVDFGANDSDNTRSMYTWNGSSWVRKTLNKTVSYGDKQWYCSGSGGYGTINASNYNLNQNVFNFWAYINKDYDGDRNVAQFGNTTQGWRILWLADGRIQWSTYYGGSGYHSYSSNYITANNWASLGIDFTSTGTGNGTLNFNGTSVTANRSGRHQYSGLSCVIGVWGMMYRDHIRVKGVDWSGTSTDSYIYINNFAVKSGAQTNGVLSLNDNNVVTQDTTVSWT